MLYVRVYRGAGAASDHHLVLAKIKMKLKTAWVTRSTRPCYNVAILKNSDVLHRFRLCHQILQKEQEIQKIKGVLNNSRTGKMAALEKYKDAYKALKTRRNL